MRVAAGVRIVAFGVGLGLCLPAGLALAQQPSLAELAQKEQERKKALKAAPAKVYTDKDLPKSSAPPAVASAVPPSTPVAAEEKPAEQPKPPESEEATWRSRMAQAREALRRAEAFAEALQSRINALTADVVNRDDPYQRAKLADDRLKALAELQRVQGEIEQSKKEIADIEEEARKAGVPPGWVR
jgi:nucleotide-binding universal stress UspA family protein